MGYYEARRFFIGHAAKFRQGKAAEYRRCYPFVSAGSVFRVVRLEQRPPSYVIWARCKDSKTLVCLRPGHLRRLGTATGVSS